jgi:predicted ATP-dependent endonuclease of OLD family
MKLDRIILKNYRGFAGEHEIPIDRLTAFVGRNDAGKSSIMDALGAFFEHPLCKPDTSDVCVYVEAPGEMRIGCVFSDLPDKIVLDAAVETSLANEYLLDADGKLEIHKVWSVEDAKLGRLKTVVVAQHPTAESFNELLQTKRPALQKKAKDLGVADNVNLNENPSLRKGIWDACPDLKLAKAEIQIDKEDAKTIGEQVAKHFPAFALFRADRPSTDEDAEVQDPLKVAIQQAIAELEPDFEAIKNKVREKAIDVAERTLKKLNDFDKTLAETLEPNFSKALKWDSVFKLSLDGDDGISVNKRGSGVRRLILFSFFRAEAERLREQSSKKDIIYAIEEPETAQHPANQRKVIEALLTIAETDGHQVLLTTHVPGLAGMLPVASIRYVKAETKKQRSVSIGADAVLAEIAKELGILPDKRARVVVCVEGPTDIHFLHRIGHLLHTEDPSRPNLASDHRIALILLGGSTLRQWVDGHLLRNIGLPEVHIYDRDMPKPDGTYKYQDAVNSVNARGDGSKAFLTVKREMENYLHPDALTETFAACALNPVVVNITDDCDVEQEVANQLGCGKVQRRAIKSWLSQEAADRMTIARLDARNGKVEIVGWLTEIASHL